MARPKIENPNGSGTDESKLFKLLGNNTNSMLVFMMFLVTIIIFAIYFCVYEGNLQGEMTTGFFTILGGLIGYFTASLKK